MALQCHLHFTSVSFRFHFDSTSVSLRLDAEYTSTTSISLWPHSGLARMSHPSHLDFTSISLQIPFEVSLNSLRIHVGFVWFNLGFTSNSPRIYVGFTSSSLRFHFDRIRCHCDSAPISRRLLHFYFNAISLRWHFAVAFHFFFKKTECCEFVWIFHLTRSLTRWTNGLNKLMKIIFG